MKVRETDVLLPPECMLVTTPTVGPDSNAVQFSGVVTCFSVWFDEEGLCQLSAKLGDLPVARESFIIPKDPSPQILMIGSSCAKYPEEPLTSLFDEFSDIYHSATTAKLAPNPTLADLDREMDSLKPDCLVFSLHRDFDGLTLNSSDYITNQVLIDHFKNRRDKGLWIPRVVIFNTCGGAELPRQLHTECLAEFVIYWTQEPGMKGLPDQVAVAFSQSFMKQLKGNRHRLSHGSINRFWYAFKDTKKDLELQVRGMENNGRLRAWPKRLHCLPEEIEEHLQPVGLLPAHSSLSLSSTQSGQSEMPSPCSRPTSAST